MKRCILLLSLLLPFTGCSLLLPDSGIKDIGADNIVKMAKADAAAREACEDRMKAELAADIALMSKMDQTAIYNYLQSKQIAQLANRAMDLNAQLIAHLTGKTPVSANQCSSTTVWDYLASSDAERYELAGKITDMIRAIGTQGLTMWGYREIASVLMSGSRSTTNIVGNNNSTGNNISVDNESSIETTITDEHSESIETTTTTETTN